MSSLERWQAALNGEKPDRVPMDYWATPETTESLLRHLRCTDYWEMAKRLRLDPVVPLNPRYIGPPLPSNTDVYGCRYADFDTGSGVYNECVGNPLAGFQTVEEIRANYTWPRADLYDFSTIGKDAIAWSAYPLRAGGSEPFWTYKFLRGDAQAFTDLVLNPEIAHYCLDEIHRFNHEMTRRALEAAGGRVLITYVAEDLGAQDGLMLSPAQIREFILPNMRAMIALTHDAGAYAFHHDDGAIRAILPELVEAGIDILNPIQWRCPGMDRAALARNFGERLVFHGGMDNQQTLPFGSVEQVRAEVAENIEILGKRGRYILAPCHNIQSLTPPENIVAMYDACFELGREGN